MTPLWVSGPPPPPRGDAEDHRSAPLRSLKLECEKLLSEKTEMQRHYVMVSPPRSGPAVPPPPLPSLPPPRPQFHPFPTPGPRAEGWE